MSLSKPLKKLGLAVHKHVSNKDGFGFQWSDEAKLFSKLTITEDSTSSEHRGKIIAYEKDYHFKGLADLKTNPFVLSMVSTEEYKDQNNKFKNLAFVEGFNGSLFSFLQSKVNNLLECQDPGICVADFSPLMRETISLVVEGLAFLHSRNLYFGFNFNSGLYVKYDHFTKSLAVKFGQCNYVGVLTGDELKAQQALDWVRFYTFIYQVLPCKAYVLSGELEDFMELLKTGHFQSASELRAHPGFWSSEERTDYLCSIAYDKNHIQNLNDLCESEFGVAGPGQDGSAPWKMVLQQAHIEPLTAKVYKEPKDIFGVIRDCTEHFNDKGLRWQANRKKFGSPMGLEQAVRRVFNNMIKKCMDKTKKTKP